MTQSYGHFSLDSARSSLDGASLSLPRDAAEEREREAALTAPTPGRPQRAVALVPSTKRSEIAAIVALSALLHAGGALAALTTQAEKAPPRRLSRVQIQVARPKATPAVVPPAPPPQARPRPTPVPRRAASSPTQPEPQVESAPTAPIDSGSSAPAAEDGTLFAGSGGLGAVAPPAPPPPPVIAPPTPAPVVQAREGANYAKNPRPAYPAFARRQGWEGTTLLSVQVTPAGRAGSVRIQRSSGRSALDDAALGAVKGWTFVPATQGGAPVAGWVTVPIVFKLQ